MAATWWQYRQWSFVADMNGDGMVTTSDLRLWGEWLFFAPGDALIALVGPTPLGAALELSPASLGGTASAVTSAIAWLLAFGLARYAFCFLVDSLDPTYRQQLREHRQAQRVRRRRARAARRKPVRWFRRPAPLPVEERREPRF